MVAGQVTVALARTAAHVDDQPRDGFGPRQHGLPISLRGALNAPKQVRILDRASGIGITNRADRHDNKPTEATYPLRHRPVVQ